MLESGFCFSIKTHLVHVSRSNPTPIATFLLPFDTHFRFFPPIAQDLPRLTRTSSFCNLESSAVFATADILFACFDDNETLTGWESCVEGKVLHKFNRAMG